MERLRLGTRGPVLVYRRNNLQEKETESLGLSLIPQVPVLMSGSSSRTLDWTVETQRKQGFIWTGGTIWTDIHTPTHVRVCVYTPRKTILWTRVTDFWKGVIVFQSSFHIQPQYEEYFHDRQIFVH